tara:strand:+ start:773 stop:1480 length:708 start_codon:yes stop_codon:yes gene_type:complete
MNIVDKNNLPKHVAITMDGNGRWANSRGERRIFGHQSGIKAVKETIETAIELEIKHLSLYAFSLENWERPKKEVNSLMKLLISSIVNETKTLIQNNIKLTAIGDIDKLPSAVQQALKKIINKTKSNSRLNLILAISYSGRWEILNAIKKIITEKIPAEEINEYSFKQYLTTKDVPDPELLIRTSGEYRISNFLLWQIAYSELYFSQTFWPDFKKSDFIEAIVEYQRRERRFGKIK